MDALLVIVESEWYSVYLWLLIQDGVQDGRHNNQIVVSLYQYGRQRSRVKWFILTI